MKNTPLCSFASFCYLNFFVSGGRTIGRVAAAANYMEQFLKISKVGFHQRTFESLCESVGLYMAWRMCSTTILGRMEWEHSSLLERLIKWYCVTLTEIYKHNELFQTFKTITWTLHPICSWASTRILKSNSCINELSASVPYKIEIR